MLTALVTGAISIVSVVVGVLLNEYFRRKSRIENYSQQVFDKRLEVHEELYQKVEDCYQKAQALIGNEELSPEEKHEVWSEVILNLTSFCDQHGLYLDERVVVHCTTTFVGVDEIASEQDSDARDERISQMERNYRKAKEMLREVTGLREIEDSFQSVSNAEIDSDYVQLFEELKAERG